jgi:hypothetical protein
MSETRFQNDTPVTSATDFVKRFFAHTHHAVEFRALPSKARCFTRNQNQVQQFIKEHAREDVFFGGATREGGGDKSYCREVVALWVDIDFETTPKPRAHELLKSFPLQPSVVVGSGGGLHLYFLLEEAVSACDERLEPILRCLVRALGGDGAAAEVARIMRLPGTRNFKYKPPRPCQVLEAHWDRRYPLHDFDSFAGQEHQVPTPENSDSGDKIAKGRRNVTLTRFAGNLRRAGLSETEIRDILLSINRNRCTPPLEEAEVGNIAQSVARYQVKDLTDSSLDPWSAAVGAPAFLSSEEEGPDFLEPRLLALGAITEIFSPRGLGKTLVGQSLAVKLARSGARVLYLDRDNPRREVKKRLKYWGAGDTPALKIMTREDVPPLTNVAAWQSFPFADYDVVVLDSLDAASEGVGEQDSAKPSKAIAPLLDIAHRENGPAVLVLGNCIKSGAHSRGSGVIEDRADIVFEVRDATSFRPSGEKPWVEELPPADAGSWMSRSLRRKQREKYRLAFIATKFRVGEEPDPFILEIDLTTDPWSVLDVTDAVDREGKEVREQRAREKAETARGAREALVAEIRRRHQANEVPMLKDKQAIPFLTALGLRRNAARELLNDPQGLWELRKLEGVKGHPVCILLPTRPAEEDGGGNVAPPAATFPEGFHNADFRRPNPEPTAEIPTPQESENKGATEPLIPAVVPIDSGPCEQKTESKTQISNLDFDDELTI